MLTVSASSSQRSDVVTNRRTTATASTTPTVISPRTPRSSPRSCCAKQATKTLSQNAARTAQCLVIGPAFGVGAQHRALLDAGHRCTRPRCPLVLDADALTLLAPLHACALDASDVLTPHVGEFRRAFPGVCSNDATSRIEAARAAAAHAGCVVLLKGPDTVIAAPDGRAIVNTTGTPFLATAGSGDVLAGLIAGLDRAGHGELRGGRRSGMAARAGRGGGWAGADRRGSAGDFARYPQRIWRPMRLGKRRQPLTGLFRPAVFGLTPVTAAVRAVRGGVDNGLVVVDHPGLRGRDRPRYCR